MSEQNIPERTPDGYAYRYPGPYGGLRFNGGEEVNGSRPTEAVPYWLGKAADHSGDSAEMVTGASAQQAALQRLAVGNFTPETVKAIARGALVVTDAAPAPVAEPARDPQPGANALWSEDDLIPVRRGLLAAACGAIRHYMPADKQQALPTLMMLREAWQAPAEPSPADRQGVALSEARTRGFADCIDAIRGAIAFGQQNTNRPPDGHWLSEFWNLGNRLAAESRLADEQVALHVGGEHFVYGTPEATAIVQEALYRASSSPAEVERDAARMNWLESRRALIAWSMHDHDFIARANRADIDTAMIGAAEAPNGEGK